MLKIFKKKILNINILIKSFNIEILECFHLEYPLTINNDHFPLKCYLIVFRQKNQMYNRILETCWNMTIQLSTIVPIIVSPSNKKFPSNVFIITSNDRSSVCLTFSCKFDSRNRLALIILHKHWYKREMVSCTSTYHDIRAIMIHT